MFAKNSIVLKNFIDVDITKFKVKNQKNTDIKY